MELSPICCEAKNIFHPSHEWNVSKTARWANRKKKRAQKCPFLQSKKRKVEHNILVTHQLNLGSLTKLVSIISSHKYSKVCSNLSCSSLHKHSYTVSWQEDQDPVEHQSKPCGCRPHWPVDLSVWSFLVISMQGWVFSGHCGFLSPCIDMQGEVVQLYTSNWPKLWFGPMVNWSTVQSVHPTPPPRPYFTTAGIVSQFL